MRGSTRWWLLGDLLVLEHLANGVGAKLGLIEPLAVALRGHPLVDRCTILSGEGDAACEEAIDGHMMLIGMAEHKGFGMVRSQPQDRQRLIDSDEPYAFARINRSVYERVSVINLVHPPECSIRGGLVVDDHRDPVVLQDLRGFGTVERDRAAVEEDREAAEAKVAAQDHQHFRAVQEVAAELRRQEQEALATDFEGATDQDSDGPIEALGHRTIRERGTVVAEWWRPDGRPTGGPMTSDYGDVIVRWVDGSYYYLQVSDSSHYLVPLGDYESEWKAENAGMLHSLYDLEERTILDADDEASS